MVSYVWGPHLSAPDLDRKKAPVAEQGDDQPAARVGSIRLGMAGRAERQQAVEIEVRAPLGALDDDHRERVCAVHGLDLGGVVHVGRRRDARAGTFELLDPEESVLHCGHLATVLLGDVGHAGRRSGKP